MRRLRPTPILAAAAVIACGLLTGCLTNPRTPTEVRDQFVSDEDFARVEVGASFDEVVAILGKPTAKKTTEDGVRTCRWEHVEVDTEIDSLFLVGSTEDRRHRKGAAFVELRDGRVTRTWRE